MDDKEFNALITKEDMLTIEKQALAMQNLLAKLINDKEIKKQNAGLGLYCAMILYATKLTLFLGLESCATATKKRGENDDDVLMFIERVFKTIVYEIETGFGKTNFLSLGAEDEAKD